MKKTTYYKNMIFAAALCVMTVSAVFVSSPSSGAGDPPSSKIPAAEAEKPSVKSERYQIEGTVESVSAPVNPRETLMVVDCGDSTAVELILAPATRYYPSDYYPCAGDRVKVNYAVLGVFKKYVIAYGVSLVEEFSGITKDSHKILKK